MAKLKTRKAIRKRFKMTKTGKILRRPVGQDHYLMKKTGKQRRKKRKLIELAPSEVKKVKKLLLR